MDRCRETRAVRGIEVEVICSDSQQHRERVEKRTSDISGLKLPTWEEVMSREYERWEGEHIAIDTAGEAWRRTSRNYEDFYRRDDLRATRVHSHALGANCGDEVRGCDWKIRRGDCSPRLYLLR